MKDESTFIQTIPFKYLYMYTCMCTYVMYVHV